MAGLEHRNPADFWIGCLHIQRADAWILDFPGVCIGDRWLACEKGMPQSLTVTMEDADMDMLVEFVIHMKKYGQLAA